MTQQQGWVKQYRKILTSEIWLEKPDKWLKIWLYILMSVNHEDRGEHKRGEAFMKYEWIMAGTGATQDQVYHCTKWLKRAKQISTKKATRGFYVKVLRYNQYQDIQETKSDTKKRSRRDTDPDTGTDTDTDTINKKKELRNQYSTQFDTFWELYDKKIDRHRCVLAFNKLSLKDIGKILKYVPTYVKSTPERKYRKNPSTFINNKSWENEIMLKDELSKGDGMAIYNIANKKFKERTK